jgi:two-component system chemotaxis response regulator CheB
LLVDDEVALLRAFRRFFHAVCPDWEVACARHGAEAVDLMTSGPFDAVVLDLHMPVMDGLSLLEHLKRWHPATLRIVHASHIDASGDAAVVRLADEIVPKPAPPQDLVTTLLRALALRPDSSVEYV